MHRRNALAVTLAVVLCLAGGSTRAVILLGTGNPAANTTAPAGELAGSGWQYQGTFGGFLGTPVAPQFFITAKHVGFQSSTFVNNGTSYDVLQGYGDPFSDLILWRVSGTFATFAPLVTAGHEPGQPLVVIGRGTQRGGEVIRDGQLRGWFWGGGDGVQRWGQNVVTRIVNGGPLNQYVFAAFDQTGGPNEAHLSVGDSGGAVFVREDSIWKLAGISYAVDGPFFTDQFGNGQFFGAVFDARGFYYRTGQNQFSIITGAAPVPSGFYASRIASKLGWIYNVVDPNGDVNANGISNRLEYARSLNLPAPEGPGAPGVAREGNALAFSYRRVVGGGAPQFTVQQSTDLLTWTNITPPETIVAVAENVQTVKALVPMTGTRIFLRLAINP
jgi:hypothetical protein